MGVTTNDIARICQVSRTTVIRALNNQGRISEETKQRILSTAKELGYRPDLLARGLVKGKTMYIGVVVYDVRNQYFAQMLSAIEKEAQLRGYCINITLHGKDRNKERQLLQRLADYRMDGLLLSPVNSGQEFSDFLESLGLPLVILGNKVSDKIPFVGIDERQAAREAAEKIIRAGYEKIVFVCPPLAEETKANIYTHQERKEGFSYVMETNPLIESQVISGSHYVKEAEEIIENAKKKTAFFCSGDVYALELMKRFKGKGFKAPSDYGIMGFDNIDFLEYLSPRLSTIYNSVEEVAKKAVELLLDKIEGKEIPGKILADYKMIEGETL